MRLLEKYVTKSYVSAFFLCIALLIVLGVIGDILGFLDDIVKKGIPISSIISFYFYLAPFAFVNMVPFACLLSAVYVFNDLSKHHEVTAVIASGVSLWRLMRPILLVTFAICVMTFIVNDRFVPSTMEKSNRIRREELEGGKKKGDYLIKDLAVYGKNDQIIYAKSFSPELNILNDVVIHKQSPDRSINQKISAKSVKWYDDRWIGQDVITFKSNESGDFKGDPDVSKAQRMWIEEKPEDFSANQWDPKFMSYGRLKQYLGMFGHLSSATMRRLSVDLHYKLALPFTALITVLVGVPFSIETGRASALIGMARGITIAILYLPVMAVSLALGKSGVLPPVVAAWLSNVLFAMLGVWYVNRKS